MKAITYIIMILLVVSFRGYSQKLPINNQFYINKVNLSPAYVGEERVWNLSLLYRKEIFNFQNIPGSPELYMLSLSLPGFKGSNDDYTNKRIGFGIILSQEKVGLRKRNTVACQVGFHFQLTGISCLSFGLSPYYSTEKYNMVDINSGQVSDPLLYNLDSDESFDFSFGSVLKTYRLELSIKTNGLMKIQHPKITADINAFYKMLILEKSNWYIYSRLMSIENKSLWNISILTEKIGKIWGSFGYSNYFGANLTIGYKFNNTLILNLSVEAFPLKKFYNLPNIETATNIIFEKNK